MVTTDHDGVTINNARLWDPGIIQETYNSLQNLQTYYQIGDVDVDRYLVNNETRQVLIAARGLNSADLPSQSFVNRHIIYTHGYGVVASPSNAAIVRRLARVLPEGHPDRRRSRTRSTSAPARRRRSTSRRTSGATCSSTRSRSEFNYQTPGKTDQFTRYKGKDGVTMSNIVRRAAFALRFGSLDPLISGQVTSKTKVLMERDIRARVAEARAVPQVRRRSRTPSRSGTRRCGSSTGTRPPRCTRTRSPRAASSGLDSDFNYVRNSVKATVDAYDGTVTFYVFDPNDPIIQSWRKAVPRPLHRRVEHVRRSSERTSATPKTCSRCRRTSSVATTSPSPAASTTAAPSGSSRPTPDRARCPATDFGALIDAGSADTSANAQPQAATSTGAADRSVLPLL